MRISEAVAIDCEHIQREADGTGRLELPHSKTDQEGKGATVFLTAKTVQAIDALQKAAGYTKGPLFRRNVIIRYEQGQVVGLTILHASQRIPEDKK